MNLFLTNLFTYKNKSVKKQTGKTDSTAKIKYFVKFNSLPFFEKKIFYMEAKDLEKKQILPARNDCGRYG